MITTNFHTHTIYCDGKNTPEEMVEAAIQKGFTALGFSGHSYFEPEKEINMSLEDQKKYFEEITALKEKYKGKLKIFCGIEQDILSDLPQLPYDYIIGSVHNIYKNGRLLNVDFSASDTKKTVDNIYGGDFDAFAEDYFASVSLVCERINPTIIGHIDLVSKFNEQNGYIESERYLAAAKRAVNELAKYNVPFEINTGAMARGSKSIPYPSTAILKMIKEANSNIVFSSDCHDKDFLDYGFNTALQLAKNAGFTQHGILTENGIQLIAIEE